MKLIHKLKDIFDEVIKNSQKYKSVETTSIVEAINRSINSLAPKDVDYPKSYDMRINNTISRLTDGEMFAKSLFDEIWRDKRRNGTILKAQ